MPQWKIFQGSQMTDIWNNTLIENRSTNTLVIYDSKGRNFTIEQEGDYQIRFTANDGVIITRIGDHSCETASTDHLLGILPQKGNAKPNSFFKHT